MDDSGGRAWRVVVVDDHELLSSALEIALGIGGGFEVVATASTLAAGCAEVARHRPDVILTDRRLPDGDVDQHVRELVEASPTSRILLMTGWATERSSLAALEAGAHGVISKAEPIQRIVEAVGRVAAGELILPAEIAERLLGRRSTRRRNELSARELDVLEALASGEPSALAAARLCMSQNTLRNHLSRAMLKLGVHDRLSAVTEAMRLGLVAPRTPAASASTEASPR
ncbi:MAG TPA: response regulator transcription factor [Acidimicrobiales bacterium]|nr:response regulator transcription factor [Acidimicrobiales bacterium]